MLICIRSQWFLLPTFLFVLSTYLSLSDGASRFRQIHTGLMGDSEQGGVSWGVRRSLLAVNNTSLILAAERTHRKDPLDGFDYYKGGWNISEKHYIFSVAFTAAPLFIIAAIWFVGFGLCLLVIGFCYCCCHRQSYGYSRTAYALSLIFLSFFTIAAICGCVVLYTGQGKFHKSTQNALDYVIRQADITVKNLRNVSDYLAAAKRVGVDQVFLPQDVQNNIGKVELKINASANTLELETKNHSSDIQHVLDSMRVALIIIAAVMLLLVILGFLFSVFGMQCLVYTLVTMGWILVAGTFILCGIFLLLHNVVADTCVAMDQWVQNPVAHTALDDILPCVDSATAQEALSESKNSVFQVVGVVNQIITNVSNANVPPGVGRFYYNQSGPLVPLLCNPFNPDKTGRSCASGEVDFSNATQVWKSYVCQVSGGGICSSMGRLTPNIYNQMKSAVNVSYGLYHYGPFLGGLLDCSFVRETFSGISDDHCPNLRQYSKWIYIGLTMVSAAVMVSLIFWVLYARERRHRKYTKLAM